MLRYTGRFLRLSETGRRGSVNRLPTTALSGQTLFSRRSPFLRLHSSLTTRANASALRLQYRFHNSWREIILAFAVSPGSMNRFKRFLEKTRSQRTEGIFSDTR